MKISISVYHYVEKSGIQRCRLFQGYTLQKAVTGLNGQYVNLMTVKDKQEGSSSFKHEEKRDPSMGPNERPVDVTSPQVQPEVDVQQPSTSFSIT